MRSARPRPSKLISQKPKTQGSILEWNRKSGGPFIDAQMKSGNTNVVSWAFSSLIIPRGKNISHDAVSVDGFNSVAEAIAGSMFKDDVEFPKGIDELMDAHDKVDEEVYRLVASIEP